MPQRLSTKDPGFESAFRALLSGKRELAEDVEAAVRDIIAAVRRGGDAALLDLTRRFDGHEMTIAGLRIGDAEMAAAVDSCPKEALAALEFARSRIEAYHARQLPRSETHTDALGVELGWRWNALQSVGLYVPGGTASYPSTVLMNAVAAKVAGVPRIAMAVPAPAGALNPVVLAAARLAGVGEVYRVGGAQAVAALAFGTATIAPVDKIVGPGNAFVAAAKRQVFGSVGIDAIAGPSEVLVIADRHNDPEWIAADLLAQAEHDAAAQSILLTDDAAFAARVEAALLRQLALLPRADIAGASWAQHGAIIVMASMDEAPVLADRIAPEHLEIATREPDALAARIHNAGALFLGALTPEVIGDYVAGLNHVLPTARSARYASGLGVVDFMKRTSILKLDRGSLAGLAPAAMTLARLEGLEAHRRSLAVRLAGDDAKR
jgi:histidinol dehydrogenase